MSVPCTGPIGLSHISTEFGGLSTSVKLSAFYAGGGLVPASISGIPASGEIKFSQFRCASNTTAGEIRFDTPGEYDWVCPPYRELYCEAVGGSGGAGSSVWDGGSFVGTGSNGFAGGNSSMGIIGGGGGGGGAGQGGRYPHQARPGVLGPPGGASGGDANIQGGGKPGGAGNPFFGDARGIGGQGGTSGKSTIKWVPGQATQPNVRVASPVAGQSYKVIVGAGGLGATTGGAHGDNGAPGYVLLRWS